jgi:hypothetical protein
MLWKLAQNGDWSTAADWSTGTVPGSGDAVTISAAGSYIVTISSADVASTLTFNASQAELSESAGSLTMSGYLLVDSGLVSLNTANTIGSVAVNGGVLAFGNAGALGAGSVALNNGELLATATETLTNALTFSGTSTIAAADGTTLTLNGSFDLSNENSLNFGATGQDGVTSINTANSYGGVTILSSGTLAIGNGGALGSGNLATLAGELLGTATETFANQIVESGGSTGTTTFAAAHGTTLTLTGVVYLEINEFPVTIGAPGQDGKIVWAGAPGIVEAGPVFDVRAGTLAAANSNLGNRLGSENGTTVEAGATLDWAGNVAAINNLQGAGTVTNSSAGQTMTLNGFTDFTGTISGNLSVAFTGNATLSGLEDYTGGATLAGPITVDSSGTYDMIADVNIAGSPSTMFVNNGVFEKTGGGGVSAVTSNFINNGTLTVLSGSIQFSDGFTNHGVIHGAVSTSGGVTTVTALAPDDFNGDGMSDVLWFNPTNDTMGDWLMNNGTPAWQVVGQGSSTVNAEGFGDFTGNGTSDILWENPTNGLVGDWLMTNNQPAWQQIGQGSTTMSIVGVGDFNGDGTDDILWQNPANNYVGIWQMQNNVPTWEAIGYGSTTVNIAGVGDFTGNGKDDILWENPTNGVVGMWAINGSTPSWSQIGQGSTTMNIVGVGDFTGNRTDDVLWENLSNGTVGFWGMTNGLATSWNVVATASTSYQVAGIGDYYGGGTDDILWRNASTGDVGVWQMNNGQATWHDLGISATSFNTVRA